MKKSAASILVVVVQLALGVMAEAQQPKKVPRIGYLVASSPSLNPSLREAFHQGLRELGYLEGKNILIEYRYADGKPERLPELADELVGLKVDLIVAGTSTGARAAKKATTTIPIVMVNAGDPINNGLVASLARP